MRNLLTIAILMGATIWSATAQERRGERPVRSAEEIATQQTQRLADRLNLTTEQQEAVYSLQLEEVNQRNARFAERREAARQARAAREEAMKQQRETRVAMQQQLDEILTDEQREMLVAQREERREAMKEMRGKRGENHGKFERGERNKPRGDRRGPRPARGSQS